MPSLSAGLSLPSLDVPADPLAGGYVRTLIVEPVELPEALAAPTDFAHQGDEDTTQQSALNGPRRRLQ
jgi:hypothetical protein